jgi:hypothetical protein
MPNSVKVVKYDRSYKKELESLLQDFSKDLFNTGTADVASFVEGHWAIYLAVIDSKAVGFAGFVYNTYFGFRTPTVGLTYLYVMPEHRASKANYLLNIQSGVVCLAENLPLEHYYASENSVRMSRKIEGTKLYEAWIYDVEQVQTAFNKLNSQVTIRNPNEIQ